MLQDESLDSTDVAPRDTMAPLQADWIKPELGFTITPLDMNVRGLVPVACIEEESIRTAS